MTMARHVLALAAAALVWLAASPPAYASSPGCSSGTSLLCDQKSTCSVRNYTCNLYTLTCSSECVGYATLYYYWEVGALLPKPGTSGGEEDERTP